MIPNLDATRRAATPAHSLCRHPLKSLPRLIQRVMTRRDMSRRVIYLRAARQFPYILSLRLRTTTRLPENPGNPLRCTLWNLPLLPSRRAV
jgi:hypothetical protein